MSSNSGTRRFEYRDEKSSKFWEISVAGIGFTVCYGKIGTDGQSQPKEFADAATAEKQAHKLIAEKIGKGYQEVVAETKPSTPKPAAQPAEATKAENPPKASKPPKNQPAKPLKPEDIAKDPESTADALEALAGSSETIDRLIAKHPKAGAALLEKLSHSSDKAIRKSVCLNPNTPKQTLIRLAPQFPGDFFQNPAFDWLLLEDPNLLFDIGGGVLKNILKRPECPEAFLKWAVKHGDEGQQLAAAMNPHTPVGSLRELLKSAHSTVVAAAKGHTALAGEQPPEAMDPEQAFLAGIAEALANLSPEEATDLLEKGYLGKHQVPALASDLQLKILGYYEVLNAALSDAQLSDPFWQEERLQTVLTLLKAENICWLRYRLAADPDCPEGLRLSLLETISRDTLRCGQENFASSPGCHISVLEFLAKDEDADVRFRIAINPACPDKLRQSLLECLSKDENEHVRCELALSPFCSATLLQTLSKDKSKLVQCNVVSNPSCPEDLRHALLETLSKDKNPHIRLKVASAPQCPVGLCEDLLEKLSKDKDKFLRLEVAQNPRCPESLRLELLTKLASDQEEWIRRVAASNSKCPPLILEKLAKDWNEEVNRAARANPGCTQTMLETFSRDEDHTLRQAVASKRDCPGSVLEALSKDKVIGVRRQVAANRICPVSVLQSLSKDKDQRVVLEVASNPNCPKSLCHSLLTDLAKSEDTDIQLRVALNNNCPVEVKESLLEALAFGKEREPSIRAAARHQDLVESFIVMNQRCRDWLDHRISNDYSGDARNDSDTEKLLWATKELVRKGVNHKLGIVRALALAQPDCSIEALAKNQKHLSWLVRAAIARNHNCPEVVLKALGNDPHQVVAAMANRGLSQVSVFKNSKNAAN